MNSRSDATGEILNQPEGKELDSLSSVSEDELCLQIQACIDGKTKPPGSLGQLEKLAFQIAKLQRTTTPFLNRPTIVVFAADHGASVHSISAFPREVTAQMVQNFLNGGAAINVFARHAGMELLVADCGIAGPAINHPNLLSMRAGEGTADYTVEDAISSDQWKFCEEQAIALIHRLRMRGSNVIGFGEMGIGNTSSASLILHCLSDLTLKDCVGAGTGLEEDGQLEKLKILQKARARRPDVSDPLEVLLAFGGFEIAQMSAAMTEAYEQGMLLLIDGFISGAAFLIAYRRNPEILSSAVFCHKSREKGHAHLLKILGAEPLLDLEMRLGEATGCALAYPIVRSAVAFLNEMASFESAGVSSSSQG
ncbi:MAG TPA: nicotinate-nucleotide--dimethylbenzimidazole phosphoribosyltransferase [Leptospiraceae bacterium]|nr:nicotinate-nucleotide--dimethylbenzimidazole phosphoribosyltransferase [Spirochaetaceae bacterium]HBS06157.1 nicotinate-nucleotide--dimethylbenzimidazole phosphoribosyltransferase [Leptospiraceae bacterium]|tara:strand:- start:5761 stop:6858 length:1098 start_codon:yes stop_codon:yes gene_type:complete